MLHRCETSMTKLQCGEKGKEGKKNHSCLVISFTSAMLNSIWECLDIISILL